jgi:hypothetical protein
MAGTCTPTALGCAGTTSPSTKGLKVASLTLSMTNGLPA